MLKRLMNFCLAIILFLTGSVFLSATQAQVSSSPESLVVDGQTHNFGDNVTFEGRYLGVPYRDRGFARIEAGTIIQLNNKQFAVENPTLKLVDLKDQVDAMVELSGLLQSRNGHWWFKYKENKVVLLSANGPQLKFGSHAHWRRATVRGQLVEQLRPSLDQKSTRVQNVRSTGFSRKRDVGIPPKGGTTNDRLIKSHPLRKKVDDQTCSLTRWLTLDRG